MEDFRNKKPVELAIEIPITDEELRDFIKKELECPLPIRAGEKFEYLKCEFIALWRSIAKKHSVDNEWYFIYEDEEHLNFEINEYFVDELLPLAKNLVVRIKDAREEFLSRTKLVQSIIADKTIYDKHILRREMHIDDIIKYAISTNTSFLFLEITSQTINSIIIRAAKSLFKVLINIDKIRFSVSCNIDIGVTKLGKVTNCLMVEIGGNPSVAHCYPCSLHEAKYHITEVKSITFSETYFDECIDEDDEKFELPIKLEI